LFQVRTLAVFSSTLTDRVFHSVRLIPKGINVSAI
jgi:hypothetical protein